MMKSAVFQVLSKLQRDPDFFLPRVHGVLHIGANIGQERDTYAAHNLNVLWIEPIPAVFEELTKNLEGFPRQKAISALMSETDGKEYELHLSSNQGASSSILDLAEHKKIWPEITYTSSIKLRSVTLPTLVQKEGIDLADYDSMVLDTQGSELLILKGAKPLLPRFRFIKTEVANFEAYKGCCMLPEMDEFLGDSGFRRVRKHISAHKGGVGSYYNAVYARR